LELLAGQNWFWLYASKEKSVTQWPLSVMALSASYKIQYSKSSCTYLKQCLLYWVTWWEDWLWLYTSKATYDSMALLANHSLIV